MTSDQVCALIGAAIWVVFFYPLWSPRCRRIRRIQRRLAKQATQPRARRSTQTGPAWEQDAPYPECFEEDEEDGDLP